eukprot:CAMPEP_0197835292 /NCGR_PEP_ID=MMETSP1437-20131217/25358_1 /TAXON_ID=49252 ORGANISM="Eucampia antarctica, Strain CCMP1452" /NCGR_SAMPLE_ID=MMETSP1437 /ASSEMBLY_ACC=CAM_ASM_001096 /LENGTH=109 /DNA_ID=CAMNT_0043440617 /DNA_START=53 /DNA_END=382 /DNA_ORIENTATION=+
MMRLTQIAVALITLFAPLSLAFAPVNPLAQVVSQKYVSNSAGSVVVNMGFGMGDGDEPKTLTREDEPDDFFQTNTDKMSDEEKLPIALGGLAFVSLPFILGMVALYASK